MSPFHTPSLVKALRIVGSSLFLLMCLQKKRNRWHPYIGGTAKFGRDRDRCRKIEDITIPYSNFSQSIKDSWVVSFSANVPTTNAKSLTPLYRGTSKFGRARDRCKKIEDITIPYSNFSQSIKDSWVVSFSTHVPTKKAKSLTPLYRGDSKIWAR